MSDPRTFAIIGCGKRGRGAFVSGLRAVQDDGRCKLVAAADLSEENAAALIEEGSFSDAKAYTDHKQMLAEVKPDVAIIALWTGLHAPLYRDCVEAGVKAVICEKPMADTWGDCRAMAELAEESGIQLSFCHQRRFAPGNRLARQLIKDGVFGEIKRMDLVSPKSVLDCGTHTFDQALSFIDETPAKWVLGAIDTTAFTHNYGLYAERMATGTIVFQNGVRATMQVGGEDLDIWTGLRVIGSKGFFDINWGGEFGEVVVYDNPDYQVPEVEKPDAVEMRGVIIDCLDSLEAGSEPELSHRKALRASEIIFAIFESARSRKRIDLPLTISDHPLLAMIESGEVVVPEPAE